MFAALFGCLEPVLTITAFLSHRSPFVIPFDQKLKQAADRAKQRLAGGEPSDHRAVLNAYVYCTSRIEDVETLNLGRLPCFG